MVNGRLEGALVNDRIVLSRVDLTETNLGDVDITVVALNKDTLCP